MAPADAQDLLAGVPGDEAAQEGVHVQDPRVGLAGVDVAAAEDDEVEVGWVGEPAVVVPVVVGGLVEGELGVRGDGADGALVRGPDGGEQARAVGVEQDGDAKGWPCLCLRW